MHQGGQGSHRWTRLCVIGSGPMRSECSSGSSPTILAISCAGASCPRRFQSWSLASLQQRVFKTGGRLIRRARYFILQLAESYLTRRLFGQILGRIERLAWHPT